MELSFYKTNLIKFLLGAKSMPISSVETVESFLNLTKLKA